MGMNDC